MISKRRDEVIHVAEEEELSTSFQMPPMDSKKGQMMLIYLPEGAVIVDRGEVTNGNVPPQISVEQIGAQPIGAQPIGAQPIGAQPIGAQPIGAQPIGASQSPSTEPVRKVSTQRRHVEHIVLRRRHKIDWVHTINIAFTSCVALVSIAPWLMTAIFGISVFGVKTSIPALDISRGDLIVSHVLSADRVMTGDVVLLRDNNTWNLKIRQVTSKTSVGNSMTIATNSGALTPTRDVLSLANATSVRYCSSYIPFFGYFVMIFTSIALKILVVVSVLLLNVAVYFRRRQTRVVEEKLAFVAK